MPTPYDFGAKGNGVTDDTKALAAFFAAGGGSIPTGRFPFNGPLQYGDGFRLTGWVGDLLYRQGWLKYRPAMQLNKQTAEEKLRDDLIGRVEKLEQRLEEERTQHEAAMAMMRHRLNNSDQSIEALLLILDDDELPEKLKAKVAKIRDLRERQKRAEEHERDTIRAAVVAAKTAAAPPPVPPAT